MIGQDAHKEILLKDYKRIRKLAEKHRERKNPERAATKYRKAASLLREVAELEDSDRLQKERLSLAKNLEAAADALTQPSSESSRDTVSRSGDQNLKTGQGRNPRRGPPDQDEGLTPNDFLEEPPDIDFDDVGGMTDLKQILMDKVVDPLERPDLYEEYGLGVVNGVLLFGPPGTGKTYITRALAGKLSYNFIEVKPSDLTSSLVGQAAENIAQLFSVAKDNQPCLVFLDEVDAIAGKRSGGARKSQSERQMVNQLLTELSEIQDEDVVVVAATNLPDEVDDAFKRSGRFDERIEVPAPDGAARKAILRIHLRDRPVLLDEIDWNRIEELTEGYSASDMELIAANAARQALKDARDAGELHYISQGYLEQSIEETPSSLEAWSEGDSEDA